MVVTYTAYKYGILLHNHLISHILFLFSPNPIDRHRHPETPGPQVTVECAPSVSVALADSSTAEVRRVNLGSSDVLGL